jgi:hypothetical protein
VKPNEDFFSVLLKPKHGCDVPDTRPDHADPQLLEHSFFSIRSLFDSRSIGSSRELLKNGHSENSTMVWCVPVHFGAVFLDSGGLVTTENRPEAVASVNIIGGLCDQARSRNADFPTSSQPARACLLLTSGMRHLA